VHVADELLGDRAGSAALAEDVVLERAGNADDVNAVVLIEPMVFNRNKCLR